MELGSTSTALLALAFAGLCAFGCLQLYFVLWFRKSATAARARFAAVPVAKIADDGTTSIVTGVAVHRPGFGRIKNGGEERQSLLTGGGGF